MNFTKLLTFGISGRIRFVKFGRTKINRYGSGLRHIKSGGNFTTL